MAVKDQEPSSLSVARPAGPQPKQGKLQLSDHFIKIGTLAVDKVLEWRIPLLGVVVSIFVVTGIISLYDRYKVRKNEEASGETFQILSDLETNDPMRAIGVEMEDSPEQLAEKKGKYETAAKALGDISTKYATVPGGVLAGLDQANLLVKADKHEDAAAAFQRILDSGATETLFRFRALSGLGHARLTLKQYDDARAAFEKITREMDGIYKEVATMDLARVAELKKDAAAAIQIYEQFLKDNSDSARKDEIESRIRQLKNPTSVTEPPTTIAPLPEPAVAPANTEPAPSEAVNPEAATPSNP